MATGKAIAIEATGLLVKYDVTEEAIEKLREEFKDTTFDTPQAYEIGRKRIGVIRELRGKVEDRRKDLKADSLEFGRKVDSAARVLTNKLKEIEEPLIVARKKIDDEEARIKREAERAEFIALEAEQTRKREEAEAAAKLVREEEEKRLAAERERLAAEQARIDEDKRRTDEANRAIAEQQRIERERLDADREEFDRRRREAEQVEEDRKASIRQQEARRQAEIDAAAAAERAAAAAPDVEKLKAYEQRIRELAADVPIAIESDEVRAAFAWGSGKLLAAADVLARFKLKGPA